MVRAFPSRCVSGNASGNFGPLDWSIYGNDSAKAFVSAGQTIVNLPTSCSGSSSPFNANDRLALNDMIGVDHPISAVRQQGNSGTFDPADVRNDRSHCQLSNPPDFFARPNEVATQTGNAVRAGTENGLINGASFSGFATLRGRFDRYCNPNGVAGWSCTPLYNNGSNERGASGSPIDDTPLWEFLSTDLVGGIAGTSPRSDGSFRAVPNSCLPSAFTSNPTKATLLTCMTDYATGGYGAVVSSNGDRGTILFGKDSDGEIDNNRWDITAAPRFGFVPLLWDNTFPNGQSGPVKIRAFRPVYFQTMYMGCNNNSCAGIHNPGEPWNPVPSNRSLDAISAMSFSLSMLPPGARDVAPAGRNDLQITLVK